MRAGHTQYFCVDVNNWQKVANNEKKSALTALQEAKAIEAKGYIGVDMFCQELRYLRDHQVQSPQ